VTPLFALAALAASWDTASLLSRCLEHDAVKQLVSRCFLCAAVFLAVVHVLGFLQLLGGLGVVRIDLAAGLAVLLAIATRLVLSRVAPSARSEHRARFAAVVGRVLRHPQREPALAGLVLCAVVVHALLLVAVLSAPPRGFDALWYHLPNALRWYRTHTLGLQTGGYVELYPGNGELFGLPFLTLENDSWVGLVQYPWFMLAALITALLAQRTGAPDRVAQGIGLTVLTIPLLVYQAMEFYVDVIAAALSLGSLLYLIDWMRNRRAADLILCLLTASMMLGTKYTATLTWLFTAVVIVVVDVRARSRGSAARMLQRALLVCGLGTLFTWVWWARNFTATGNPIAPVHVRFLLQVLLTGNPLSSVFAAPGADSLADLTRSFAAAYGPLTVLVPLALATAAWECRAGRLGERSNIIAVSFAYVGWNAVAFALFLTHDPRFVIAPVLVSLALTTALSARFGQLVPRLMLLAALVNTGLVVHEIGFAGDFAFSINRRSRDRFYGLPAEIDQLPEGARVLLRGHPALVYPVAGARRTNVVYPSPMGPVEAEIERWNIDYVFVRSPERAEISRLAALPSLAPISMRTLPDQPWWDYWPDHRTQYTALFEVVR